MNHLYIVLDIFSIVLWNCNKFRKEFALVKKFENRSRDKAQRGLDGSGAERLRPQQNNFHLFRTIQFRGVQNLNPIADE